MVFIDKLIALSLAINHNLKRHWVDQVVDVYHQGNISIPHVPGVVIFSSGFKESCEIGIVEQGGSCEGEQLCHTGVRVATKVVQVSGEAGQTFNRDWLRNVRKDPVVL